eukprot:6186894-Pleurochrysis_carterae.AAC.2
MSAGSVLHADGQGRAASACGHGYWTDVSRADQVHFTHPLPWHYLENGEERSLRSLHATSVHLLYSYNAETKYFPPFGVFTGTCKPAHRHDPALGYESRSTRIPCLPETQKKSD